MKRTKYPRIEKKDRAPYVTGDAQDWTYQYTWEDLEESFNDSSTDIHAMRNIVRKSVHTLKTIPKKRCVAVDSKKDGRRKK